MAAACGISPARRFSAIRAAGVANCRAIGPVVATRFPIVGTVWITTTYEATARVLKDSATFTLRKEGGGAGRAAAGGCRHSIATFANNMLTMDEPDHTRLRSIVDEAFRRRAVLDMEPHIRAIADRPRRTNCSPMEARPIWCSAMRGCCRLSVICELLGLPPADRPKFIAWANSRGAARPVHSASCA